MQVRFSLQCSERRNKLVKFFPFVLRSFFGIVILTVSFFNVLFAKPFSTTRAIRPGQTKTLNTSKKQAVISTREPVVVSSVTYSQSSNQIQDSPSEEFPIITAILPDSGMPGHIVVIRGQKFREYQADADFDPACDLNQDGIVENLDLQIFLASYNLIKGQVGFNSVADINRDDKVDFDDFVIFANSYQKSSGQTYVTFSSSSTASARILSWNDTEIQCEVPVAVGTGPVVVHTPQGVSNDKIFTFSTIEQPYFLTACQLLNQEGKTYYLDRDLSGDEVTANCMNITAPDVTLDCQGHSIINHNLKSALVHSNQNRTTVQNCTVESYLGTQYSEYEVSLGIRVYSSNSTVQNNVIRHTGSGIYVIGNNNLVKNNRVENTMKGIRLRGDNNIAENNLTRNNRNAQGWGLEVWKGSGNHFINNKSYGNNYGVLLSYADNSVVRCGEVHTNYVKDIYLYNGSNNVSLQGVNPVRQYVSSDSDMTYSEYSCSDVECQWQGDVCVPKSGIKINSPFSGFTTRNNSIAVQGQIFGPKDVQVFVNGVHAIVENDRFLAYGVELKQSGKNVISAQTSLNGQVLATDQIEAFYVNSSPFELVIDDFEDAALRSNSLGFWTSDEQTCAVNKDISGAHNITWDGTGDYWHTDLFDPQIRPKGFDAGSYDVLSFLVKGTAGTFDFTIEIQDVPHGQNFNKRVLLSDFVSLTDQWQKVTIPLSLFTSQGVWKSQMRSIVFRFDQQPSGTINIDNIKLSSAVIDDFSDVEAGINNMGYATSDSGSLVENSDSEGARKLTWDNIGDVWFSALWDQQYEWNASGFKYLIFDIKGEEGAENFNIILQDMMNSKSVEMSHYFTLTDKWQKAVIPLADFSVQGVDMSRLQTLIFDFSKTSFGTIYVDNFEFTNANPSGISKPLSSGAVQIIDDRLVVHGAPFIITGVGYQPTPIGLDVSTDFLYQDEAIYNRDLPILRNMGCNTIRTWKKVNNAAFLDASYGSGEDPIYVIMGFPISPLADLSDAAVRDNIKNEFRLYVENYKDHPAVLLWALGNEENIFYKGDIADWYSLANELAEIAYSIEGSGYHPVAVVNGSLENIGDAGRNASDDNLNFVDIWGVNNYRGYSNRSFFRTYDTLSAKSLWISEYGADSWHTNNAAIPADGYEDQEEQGKYYVNNWREIISASGVLGGTLMEYSDEWWKAEGKSWDTQDHLGFRDRYDQPDNYSNEEFWGLFKVQKKEGGFADHLIPKKSFDMIKKEYNLETQDWWRVRWEFNTDGDSEGFSDQSGSTSKMDVRNGVLVADGYESAAIFWSKDNFSIAAADFPVIQTRVRLEEASQGAVVFKRISERGVLENKFVLFDVISDENFHVYSINLHDYPDWTGEIVSVGVAFLNVNNAQVQIDYIRLSEPGPQIEIINVNDGDFVNTASLRMNGRIDDFQAVIKVNGTFVSNQSGEFTADIPLIEGQNVFLVEAVNDKGMVSQKKISIICDTTPPEIMLTSPLNGHVSVLPYVNVEGTVADVNMSSVSLNGISVTPENGIFSLTDVPLVEGVNLIIARAEDKAGNVASHAIEVVYSQTVSYISITSPQNNYITSLSSIQISGVFQGDYSVITVNGNPAVINDNTFSSVVSLPSEGAYLIEARMTALIGGPFLDEITVIRDTQGPQIWITTPQHGEKIRGY